MKVTVRTFALARDAFGFEAREFDLRQPSLGHLRETLGTEYPEALAVLNVCRFAVNKEYAGDSRTLKDGDDIAVIPPVSGG